MKAFVIAIFICALAAQEPFPHLTSENLNKKEISLPEAVHGKIALLAAGFSRNSGNSVGPWIKRFERDFGSDSRYTAYQAAVLEGVPRLIRGMVVGGIRKDIPADHAGRFLTVFHDEKQWRELVRFEQADDAYLVLLDPAGGIRWQHHGPFRESDYLALHDRAVALAQ